MFYARLAYATLELASNRSASLPSFTLPSLFCYSGDSARVLFVYCYVGVWDRRAHWRTMIAMAEPT